MTKRVKEELFSAFQSLRNAECLLEKYCSEMCSDTIHNMLIDMQQLAIEVGNKIEKIESKDTSIIHLLEEYCEYIWQYSISDYEEQRFKIYYEIIKIHNLIEKVFQDDITIKTEVVFFPYKASMWDSLESIWIEAKNNHELDVYVVPIPYYYKSQDGNFQKMHYEGDEYPEYVPVTDWKEYDVAVRRPDVAFIHNPYDEANRVTSVHPAFYTKKLKEAVDQVVYIPYFIYGDDIYEHFCVCPGTIYADKVILQSNKVREVYIRCFNEWIQRNNLGLLFTREIVNNKFLALGSPKVDKVVHSKKNDFILPESWRKKLKGKKAVLYNTGVSGLLSGNEQQLKKIEDVIVCFRNREDVVLWWRPHPLNEGTCNSMRPQLLEKYNKIVESYKKEDFGIYDNTPDLYRALAYTDMYYGDDSSLVHLCGVQGKPIMMQNIHLLLETSKEEDRTVYFYDCAYEDGKIWFVSACYNGLYEMDTESGNVVFIGKIPGEDELASLLYESIIKVGDNIWMIPTKAKEIACYNLKMRQFLKIKLEDKNITKSEKFRGAHLYGNYIYMIPWEYEGIVCLNLVTKSLSKIEGVSKIFKSCLYENSIYMPINDSNRIRVFNLDSKKIIDYKIGNGVYRFSDIIFKDNKFWLIPSGVNGNIICWNEKNGIVDIYGNYPKDFKHSLMFRAAVDIGEYIWLLPEMGNMMIRMRCDDGLMEGFCKTDSSLYYCPFAKKLPNGFLTTTAIGAKYTTLFKIDISGNVVTRFKCEIEEPALDMANILDLNKKANYKKAQEYILWENTVVNIKSILDDLKGHDTILDEEKIKYCELFNCVEKKAAVRILNNVTRNN